MSAADWTAGAARLLVRCCAACGHRWYLPRAACPLCGGIEQLDLVAEGGGLCVAVTWLHTVGGGSDASPDGPLGLALVELDEGPIVMGRVHDDALAPGARTRLDFRAPPGAPADVLLPSFARESNR